VVPTYAPTSPIATGWGKPASSIPWNHVGSGWTLAVWSPVASQQAYQQRLKETTTLYLVSPAGARYEEAVFRPGEFVQVADWSGDRQQAVLTSTVGSAFPAPGQAATVTDLDLVTGATVGSFAVKDLVSVKFTKPEGLALLADFDARNHAVTLDRMSVSGATELNFPTTFPVIGSYSGSAIYTPDGTDVVVGAAGGLAVVSNAGPVVAELPVAGAAGGCTVQGWWAAGVAEAACSIDATPTYVAVPISGAKPYAVASEPFPADLWHIPSGTYSQNAACGIEWIVKLGAKGAWNRVELPGVLQSQSQFVAGTFNDTLLTVATPSCSSGKNPPAPSLMWYDPTQNKTTVLLGTSVNGGAVLDVLEFGSVGLYVG
jgi:TolB protein